MTTLFISHGAPTLAMEPGKTGEMLHQLGLSLPRPRAILVVSATARQLCPATGDLA